MCAHSIPTPEGTYCHQRRDRITNTFTSLYCRLHNPSRLLQVHANTRNCRRRFFFIIIIILCRPRFIWFYGSVCRDKYFTNWQQCRETSWVQRGFWMHGPASWDEVCLDPSHPRITDQFEPTRDVEGGREGEREDKSLKERVGAVEWKNSVALGLIGETLAFFRKWNNRETGNAITPTEKRVKQVVSSLAEQVSLLCNEQFL